MKVVGVTLKEKGKIYYFLPTNKKIKKGKKVIVETEYGMQIGTVEKEEIMIKTDYLDKKIKKIIRVANKKDIEKNNKNIIAAAKAKLTAKKLVKKQGIDIKILDANYTLNRDKLIFKFVSDTRIDFRNLVYSLANIYKTRIELKQIGSRDKAKEIGGCGQCGRTLCCSSFLKKIDSVSINMAKNQNITLNPSKINGLCGRLLCCLKYENECYINCKKELPNIGDEVETKHGKGKVISLDILNKKYKVFVEKQGLVEETLDECN